MDLNLNIFPNPNKGVFNIEIGNTTRQNILVFDLAGKEVAQFTIEPGTNLISLNQLESGYYILRTATNQKAGVLIIQN